MLHTKPINHKLSEFNKIKTIYSTLFPAAERVPFWFLMMKSSKKFVDFLAFYDQGNFIGFAYLITQKDLTFILYIAVDSAMQSRGYGRQMLHHIKTLYPNNKFILDIEIAHEKAGNYEQREKRRNFYIKNGYTPAGFIWEEETETYEVLTHGGVSTIEEFQALIKKFTGVLLYHIYKPQFTPIT